MAQERVCGDLEIEVVALFGPGRGLDHADEDLVLRLGRRERAEVVFTRQQLGAAGKPLDVQRVRAPPASAALERAPLPAPAEPVAI